MRRGRIVLGFTAKGDTVICIAPDDFGFLLSEIVIGSSVQNGLGFFMGVLPSVTFFLGMRRAEDQASGGGSSCAVMVSVITAAPTTIFAFDQREVCSWLFVVLAS